MPRKKNRVIFVSHTGVDTWVAMRIVEKINRGGAKTFLDEADISIGDDFESRMLQGLENADELLVLLTPWSVTKPYLWAEIGAAWGMRKRIVGVMYGITSEELQSRPGIPVILKSRDLIDINQFDAYLTQLRKRVRAANFHGRV